MPGHDPVRVALLNDHALVVAGLAEMLRPYADRVRIEDVQVKAPPQAAVDIALYDTYGVDLEQAHWSHYLGSGWTPSYVVVYSWGNPDTTPLEVADRGPAVLQISKALDGAQLVRALEQINATGTYDVPREAATTTAGPTGRQWPGQAQGLTERESEIVSLIVEGLNNNDVAARLFLGINTVKTYIRSAYRTMGVTSRSNAVLWGIDHGFRTHRPSR